MGRDGGARWVIKASEGTVAVLIRKATWSDSCFKRIPMVAASQCGGWADRGWKDRIILFVSAFPCLPYCLAHISVSINAHWVSE